MIIRLVYIFLFVSLTINLNAKNYKSLGYYDDTNSDLKYKDSSLALKYWAESFSKDTNLNVKIKSYDNYNKFINDYFNGKLEMIFINPYHYMINQKKIDKNTLSYWYFKTEKINKFQSMYLVSNKKSNIKKISDLVDKKIVIKKNNYFGKLFLNELFLKNEKRSSKKFISKINYVNDDIGLLKTYFGEYDACIIDSNDYNIMYELNPAIEKKLNILNRSKKIFSNRMVLIHKKNNTDDLDDFESRLENILSNKIKYDLFTVLKIEDITTFSPKENKQLNDYYNNFVELDKRYNK